MIDSYSPRGFGDHVIRFTFQCDKYKLVEERTMNGNCTGFSVIEYTLDAVIDEMLGDDDWCEVTMVADDGEECDFDLHEEGIKDTLVAVEILSWTREGE